MKEKKNKHQLSLLYFTSFSKKKGIIRSIIPFLM
jgi:hypothetical protein